MDKTVDVAVIGAGSAGLAAVREIRRARRSFVLIHGGPDGTTCARAGCMPSKSLIQIADDFHRRRVFAAEGIAGAERLRLDAGEALARVRALRDGFVHGVLDAARGLGPHRVRGYARFLAPTVLAVGAGMIRAKRVIIATGSRPAVPPAWRAFGPRALTTDGLFDLKTLPAAIAVIGLGPNGLELAQALSRLGVKIFGFGDSPLVGGLDDPKVSRRAVRLFEREFPLRLGREASVGARGSRLRVGAGGRAVLVDAILASVGRRPNVDGLGLENLGVALSPQGVPAFDPETMRLGRLPIFIAGDASDDRQVLSEAVDAGRIAGINACRTVPLRFERRAALRVTFCRPDIAVVGKTLAQLKGRRILAGEADFRGQGRAEIMSSGEGIVRVYGDPATGRLLGAQLAAPGGEHLAHLLALAVQSEMSVFDMLRMPVYHPVLEEGLREALRDLARRIPRRSSRLLL